MGTVYALANSESGKSYVGQTWDLPRRLSQHRNDYKRRITPLNAAINKHGFDSFEVTKLVDGIEDQCTLDYLERFWIKVFGSDRRGVGYNLRKGGLGGGRMSDETKRKISMAKMGNQNRLGAKLSDESKAKMAASARGRKHSEETKQKMSKARTGGKRSEETKTKMSKSRKDYLERNPDTWEHRDRDASGKFR